MIDLRSKINNFLKLKKSSYLLDYNYVYGSNQKKIELRLYHFNRKDKKFYLYNSSIENRKYSLFLWEWSSKECYKILYSFYVYLTKSKTIDYLYF